MRGLRKSGTRPAIKGGVHGPDQKISRSAGPVCTAYSQIMEGVTQVQ